MNTGRSLQEIASMAERSGARLSLIALILLATAPLQTVTGYLFKVSVDSMTTAAARPFFLSVAVLVVAYIVGFSLGGFGVSVRVSLVESLALAQRRRMTRAILRMPLLEYEKHSRGDLVSRLTADINESSRAFTNLYFVLDGLLKFLFAAAYITYLSWQVALAVAIASVAGMLVQSASSRPLEAMGQRLGAATGQVSSRALNAIEGLVPIKVFAAHSQIRRSYGESLAGVFRLAMGLARRSAWITGLSPVMALLQIGSMVVVGGYMAAIGRLTVGGVLAIITMSDATAGAVILGPRWAEIRKSLGAYARVREIILAPADAPEGAPANAPADGRAEAPASTRAEAPADPPDEAIAVRHLTFEYAPGQKVLDDVSFDIPRGAKVAVMGRSGSGKTSLLKVLAGLYRPAPGVVSLWGYDLGAGGDFAPARLVTYVSPEAFLFSGTIAENLELGLSREPVPGEEPTGFWRALELADASSFVTGLPDGGLGYQVGERGNSLSGGQRQRLCLARGFLRETPVLLLDEPTSSLDTEAESRITRGLRGLTELTCVIVTHRFEVAAATADFILVMDGGRVVERGKHEDLLEAKGLYWSLFTGEVKFGEDTP